MGNFRRDDRSGGRRDFGRRDFGRRDFGGRSGGRDMHKAVCSKCGKDCEVPFMPTGNKPVYCSECFEQVGGGSDSRRFQDRGSRRPDFQRRDDRGPQGGNQFEAINQKLDKIIELLTPSPVKIEEEKKEEVKIEEVVAPSKKKAKTSKKKTPAVKE